MNGRDCDMISNQSPFQRSWNIVLHSSISQASLFILFRVTAVVVVFPSIFVETWDPANSHQPKKKKKRRKERSYRLVGQHVQQEDLVLLCCFIHCHRYIIIFLLFFFCCIPSLLISGVLGAMPQVLSSTYTVGMCTFFLFSCWWVFFFNTHFLSSFLFFLFFLF
jgi:hypothetical protein